MLHIAVIGSKLAHKLLSVMAYRFLSAAYRFSGIPIISRLQRHLNHVSLCHCPLWELCGMGMSPLWKVPSCAWLPLEWLPHFDSIWAWGRVGKSCLVIPGEWRQCLWRADFVELGLKGTCGGGAELIRHVIPYSSPSKGAISSKTEPCNLEISCHFGATSGSTLRLVSIASWNDNFHIHL